MAKNKKQKKKLKLRKYFWAFLCPFLIFISTTYYFYYLPKIKAPVIDETKNMTTIPPEIQTVLGAKTNLKSSQQLSLRIPILMYHYVEYVKNTNDKIRVSLNIPPYVFESQIKTLQEANYTFLTASELAKALDGEIKLPPKPILITFDDGYRDFYEDAYPILKKHNVKATHYVIVNFLNRPNHLLTNQLEEISKEGLVEIGAHTMNHRWLRGIDQSTAKYEIEESRKQLQSMLNLPIESLAYPFGAFDAQTIDVVKTAGFTNAMSTIPGIEATEENRYFLYRIRPGLRTDKVLLDYLNQNVFKPW